MEKTNNKDIEISIKFNRNEIEISDYLKIKEKVLSELDRVKEIAILNSMKKNIKAEEDE